MRKKSDSEASPSPVPDGSCLTPEFWHPQLVKSPQVSSVSMAAELELESLYGEFSSARRPGSRWETPEHTVAKLKKAVNFPREFYRRPWLGPRGDVLASTIDLGVGWHCHILSPLSPLSRHAPTALFVTKNGVLTNTPSGKPAFRILMCFERRASPVVYISDQVYFSNGVPWNPTPHVPAFFHHSDSSMVQVYMVNGLPSRIPREDLPNMEIFRRPPPQSPLSSWNKAPLYEKVWIRKDWSTSAVKRVPPLPSTPPPRPAKGPGQWSVGVPK